jgi:uncharacterized protein YhaN
LAFLFGFPGQSTDDFLFKYNQFRVHAVMVNKSNKTLECIRRKGNKDTLRNADDKTVCMERELSDFLGGLDLSRFEQLFGLDSERLVKGGQEVALGKGELGEALFAAGAGMKGLRDLEARLEERQNAFCTSTLRKGTIPDNKAKHAALAQQIRDLALPPETYAEAEAKTRSAENLVNFLRSQRTEVRGLISRLTRLRDALPTIERLTKAKEKLRALEQAPILPASFAEQYRTAIQDRYLASQTLEDVCKTLLGFDTQLAETKPPSALLAVEDEVDQLRELFGADRKQRAERQQAETFRINEEGLARDIYRDLTGLKDWDKMDEWKLRQEQRSQIATLANRQAAVFQAALRETKAVQTCRARLESGQRKLTDSEVAPDTSMWKAVVEPVAKLGPLEENARNKGIEIKKLERQLTEDFERMQPAVPGSWVDASTLRVPPSEAIGQFASALLKADQALQDRLRRLQETEADITKRKHELGKTEGTEPVPSLDELLLKRKDRDGGLLLVRRRLSGRSEERPEAEFIARLTPDRELMDATEFSVRQCDTLGDRLRQEADRVAQAETIRLQLQEANEKRTTISREVEQLADTLADLQARWEAIWAECKIIPQAPDVMRSWLNRWQSWCERKTALDAARMEYEADFRRIEVLHRQVVTTCSLDATAHTLAKAIEQVQRKIEGANKVAVARTKLEEEQQRASTDLREAEANLQQAAGDRDAWLLEWKDAVSVLRLREENPSVQTAQEYLQRLDKMHEHLKQSRLKAARVREIDRDRVDFLTKLNDVRRRVDPETRPTSSDLIDTDFRTLETDLRAAIDARAKHQQLTKQHEAERSKEQEVMEQLRVAEAKLGALVAEARVADFEGLPTAIQAARERADVSRDLRQFEELLAHNAQGESIEEFASAAQAEREGLAARLIESEDRALRLDHDVSDAEAAWNDARRILAEYQKASAEAAEAHQQAALEMSRLQDRVVGFAAIHVARTALERAKERYRARHQDTLLNRAGKFFQTLTDGAFLGLDIDNDEGNDVLTAVRRDASRIDARVRVDGLSDGTRDQLFLALRLAGIETHLVEREPVPLIVDDVLINFDDQRTKATLRCLAELAQKTQVLVFTHHRHVVESARAVDPTMAVHELFPA